MNIFNRLKRRSLKNKLVGLCKQGLISKGNEELYNTLFLAFTSKEHSILLQRIRATASSPNVRKAYYAKKGLKEVLAMYEPNTFEFTVPLNDDVFDEVKWRVVKTNTRYRKQLRMEEVALEQMRIFCPNIRVLVDDILARLSVGKYIAFIEKSEKEFLGYTLVKESDYCEYINSVKIVLLDTHRGHIFELTTNTENTISWRFQRLLKYSKV